LNIEDNFLSGFILRQLPTKNFFFSLII